MDELTLAEVLVDYCEGRAGDTAVKTHAARHTANESRLARAEVALHRNDRAALERAREGGADILGIMLAV